MPPYEIICIHGVHYAGENCWVCHPEKLRSADWLFSPELDALCVALAAEEKTDTFCREDTGPGHGPCNPEMARRARKKREAKVQEGKDG